VEVDEWPMIWASISMLRCGGGRRRRDGTPKRARSRKRRIQPRASSTPPRRSPTRLHTSSELGTSLGGREYIVDESVVLGFGGGHEIVSLGIVFDPVDGLGSVPSI